jgi:hypothetical protein
VSALCVYTPCLQHFAGLELGGLLGGTLSGVLSDKSIKAAQGNPKAGLVGRRVQICMAYTAACIGVLLTLKGVPAGKGRENMGAVRSWALRRFDLACTPPSGANTISNK